MKRSMRVAVEVGDVVDLRGAEIRKSKDGRKGLLCVIRDEDKNVAITLLAPADDADLLVGRVSKIIRVAYLNRWYKTGRKLFTNVYCEFENAFGEKPKYKAENHPIAKASAVKDTWERDWVRPEFTGGLNAEEEE